MRLTAGLLTSAVLTSLLTLVAAPATSADAAPRATGKPRVGACYDLTAEQLSKRVSAEDPIRCRRPHTVVTAGVPDLPPQLSYRSSEQAITAGSIQVCARPFAKTVGGTFRQRAQARYFVSFFRPSQAQIRAGARWVRCDVVLLQGAGVATLPLVRQPFLKRGITDRVRRCGTQTLSYVPCRGPHGFRAAGAVRLEPQPYPTRGELRGIIARRCRPFLGRSAGYATIRDENTWNAGDRTITCFKQTKS